MRSVNNSVAALVMILASLSGCGGSDGPPPVYTSQLLSDPAFDGDIQQNSAVSYTVTQGMSPAVQSIFAGIDPASQTEYRAFMDFHLTGPGGVPGSAAIDSAFLDFYVNSLQPSTATLPLRVELVSFQPPTMIPSDFDRTASPPLAYLLASPPFISADVGTNVTIDVTPLMIEAQQQGLTDFQVRILEDLGPPILGLIEINDSTGSNRASLAPQLTVTYE